MTHENKNKPVPIELLEYAKAIFDRHAADFDVLDNKAIGAMGIIGLLVGFQALGIENTVSIFKDCCNSKCPQWLYLIIFVAIIIHGISLIVGIISSLLSFQVKSIDYPTSVKELKHNYLSIKENNKAIEVVRIDIINTYKDAGESLETLNSKKASCLKVSITAIIISVVSMVIFLTLMLFYKCIY